VEAILLYVLAHPEAKDSSVGIRGCWLGDTPAVSPSQVTDALDYLEAHGCISARPIGVGHDPLYSVPGGRTREMQAILEAIAEPDPSERTHG
jgi:hypothetical protein